jgi:hypothetical protein
VAPAGVDVHGFVAIEAMTYELMEAAWRRPAPAGARPDWMEPFARAIDAAKKYVVSSTLDRVDWKAESRLAGGGDAV